MKVGLGRRGSRVARICCAFSAASCFMTRSTLSVVAWFWNESRMADAVKSHRALYRLSGLPSCSRAVARRFRALMYDGSRRRAEVQSSTTWSSSLRLV